MVKKLKSGSGEYLWEPGGMQGQPNRIIGYPYELSEEAPNTFSSGEPIYLLADLRYYHIADALDFRVAVQDQLYAESGQIGYIGRKEIDGMPVLSEAFVISLLA